MILQLIASEILTYKIVYDEMNDELKQNPMVVARLNLDLDGTLCVTKDKYWSHLKYY